MIQSMTAFARSEQQGTWGSIVCEIRSINHRYLEVSLRLPEVLQEFEAVLREQIRQQITRGKIECFVRYQPPANSGQRLLLNHDLVSQLLQAYAALREMTEVTPLNPLEMLRWPNVLQTQTIAVAPLQPAIAATLDAALADLQQARVREGAQLTELLLPRLTAMSAELTTVRARLPEILPLQRQRLLTRFADAKLKLDETRIEQEMVLLAQKIDVTEELERLDTHINEVRRVLAEGGPVGRRLDFLMQELNREANTLGSKSIDVATTRAAVELKVLIEQMREQVQNVE